MDSMTVKKRKEERKRMSGRGSTLGAVVILLCLLLGGILGFVGHKWISQGNAPASHKAIAQEIIIADIDYQVTLACVFIKASKTPMLSAFEGFTPKLVEYQLSEWGFYTGKDCNAYMNIWGPATDEVTFCIEICKMCGNTLKVSCPEGDYLLEENAYLNLLISVG